MRSLFVLLSLAGCAHNALDRLPDPAPDLSQADPALARVLERRVAASNAQAWAAWEALHTEDCVRVAPELDAPLVGRADMRAAIERIGHAVPDYHLALVRVIGTGPWVTAELRSSGTFTAALDVPGLPLPIPPTGNGFRQYWVALVRFEGERIAEIREYYDQKELVDQLEGGYPRARIEAALSSR